MTTKHMPKMASVLFLLFLAGCMTGGQDQLNDPDQLATAEELNTRQVTATTVSGATCTGISGTLTCSDGSTGTYTAAAGSVTGVTSRGEPFSGTY